MSAKPDATVDEAALQSTLQALSREQRVALLAGASTWLSTGIAQAQIPAIKLSDGPNAARGDALKGVPAASFPVGSAMAATWNPALIQALGQVLAEEAKTKDSQVLLGPTINLQRHPLGGRNFECYSEDPHLTAEIAVAFIRGVQSLGVAACAKHFVCNDAEFERHSIDCIVDERTLRELYLPPFERAVKEAGVWSVMSSYNRINGAFASSNVPLLRDVLKGEWAFDGLVVSDWGAALETQANLIGGLDLEMPGPSRTRGEKLLEAVNTGGVDPALVDDSALRMLRLIARTGKTTDQAPVSEQAIDRPEHRQLARTVASQAMVLLKNEQVLPLLPEAIGTLAVIGPNADPGQIQGGGSSAVVPHYQCSPASGLSAIYNKVVHEPGWVADKYIPVPPQALLFVRGTDQNGLHLRLFSGTDTQGAATVERTLSARPSPWGFIPLGLPGREDAPMVGGVRKFSATIEAEYLATESGDHDIGLQSCGLSKLFLDGALCIDNWTEQTPGDGFFGAGSSEQRTQVQFTAGKRYRLTIEFENAAVGFLQGIRYGIAPVPPENLLERAVQAAASADAVVLVVGSNPDWETEGNDRADMQLPANQNALVSSIIAANPNTVVVLNTGSAMAMPWIDEAAAVLQAWLPGQEFGNALADIISGASNPSGRMPLSFPDHQSLAPSDAHYPGKGGTMTYGEGLNMGYRGILAANAAANLLAPFGHGLSYTQFRYGTLVAEPVAADGSQTFNLSVTNSGDRAGRETVQLYLCDETGAVAQPPLKLAAFTQLDLEPGATSTAQLQVPARAFAYWDTTSNQWLTPAGKFVLHAGASCVDLRGQVTVER